MRLRDKVALVTGAGSGIGKAIALRFAAEAAQVVVNELTVERAEATLKLMEPERGRAIAATSPIAPKRAPCSLPSSASTCWSILDHSRLPTRVH